MSAVSNYRETYTRDENLIDTFERDFSRGYPAESDPSRYIREAATYTRVYMYMGILCVMHTCMIHVRMYEGARGRVARACVSLISPRTTSAYKLPNFLRELVQKVEKGKQCRRQDERTERGGTCTIQYPTNLVSRTGQISLTIQTNEQNSTLHSVVFRISTLLTTMEIKRLN